MAKKIDLTGQRFGRLLVVSEGDKYISPKGHSLTAWNCVCSCGKSTTVTLSNLRDGNTKSCGCLKAEVSSEKLSKIREKGLGALKESLLKDGTRLDFLDKKKPQKNNKTSIRRGVSYDKSQDRWISYINLRGKRTYLGYFKNEQDAINARKEAEEKYFKPILEKYK